MNKELPKELIEQEIEKIHKKRFAEPEEIAKVICFLASDDADYINGIVLKVDGGMQIYCTNRYCNGIWYFEQRKIKRRKREKRHIGHS